MIVALDPVGSGLARTLARPGGNVTGLIYGDPEFSVKTIKILKETLPKVRRIASIYYAGYGGIEPYVDAAERAARSLGMEFRRFPVARREDVARALDEIKGIGADALRISTAGAVTAEIDQILAFANSRRLPAFCTTSWGVERGGFMSYSYSQTHTAARAAAMVDKKILKGTKPGDIPFEYPTVYDLVINLKTAKQLGIKVPPLIMLQATRVIE